jgi:glucokinase
LLARRHKTLQEKLETDAVSQATSCGPRSGAAESAVFEVILAKTQRITIGVDLGGTSLRVGAFAVGEGLLDSIALRTRLDAGPDAVVDDMCAAVGNLIERYTHGREMVGIGVGSPGPLELPAGRLHHPPNLPGWDGFHLLGEMQRRVHFPVTIESDANAAVLAEYALGLGQALGVHSLCMLTLGTGVGNGIILDGRIWHGAAGMGGEAGHMTIYPEGFLCGCGNAGCLEACASATALTNAAERRISTGRAPGLQSKRKHSALTALELAEAARQGDPDARAIFAETGQALGIGLAGLINILNLPLYVVGGGVADSWDLLSRSLFEELERRSYVYALTAPGRPAAAGMPCGGTQVRPAKLGAEAGLLGACLLPLDLSRSMLVSA